MAVRTGNIARVTVFFKDKDVNDDYLCTKYYFPEGTRKLDQQRFSIEGSFIRVWNADNGCDDIYPADNIESVEVDYWGE